MRTGKIAGVNIILNNWFLVLLLIFSVAGMLDKVLLVFSAVIFHELSHICVAGFLGHRVKEIEVLPFGAVARIDKLSSVSAANEITIAAAGPLTSFILAGLSWAAAAELDAWQTALIFYYEVNLMLGLFNLLPALPLDGGRILRGYLAGASGVEYRAATRMAVFCGYVVSAILIVFAAAQYWLYSSINLTALFAVFFLLASAQKELDLAGLRLMRQMSGKKTELLSQKTMSASCFTALASAPLGEVIRRFRPEEYNLVLVVDENFRPAKTLTETQIWDAMAEKGIRAKIGEV